MTRGRAPAPVEPDPEQPGNTSRTLAYDTVPYHRNRGSGPARWAKPLQYHHARATTRTTVESPGFPQVIYTGERSAACPTGQQRSWWLPRGLTCPGPFSQACRPAAPRGGSGNAGIGTSSKVPTARHSGADAHLLLEPVFITGFSRRFITAVFCCPWTHRPRRQVVA